MHRFANPTRFLRLARWLTPILLLSGIVLASATIITGMIVLAWVSGVLALAGIVVTALGILSPHLLHLH